MCHGLFFRGLLWMTEDVRSLLLWSRMSWHSTSLKQHRESENIEAADRLENIRVCFTFFLESTDKNIEVQEQEAEEPTKDSRRREEGMYLLDIPGLPERNKSLFARHFTATWSVWMGKQHISSQSTSSLSRENNHQWAPKLQTILWTFVALPPQFYNSWASRKKEKTVFVRSRSFSHSETVENDGAAKRSLVKAQTRFLRFIFELMTFFYF